MVKELISASIREQFDKVKPNYLDKDYDFFTGIIGYEGDGKSTTGILLCSYVDPTFNIDRIVFTPEQFEIAFNKAQSGQAILVDEAIEIFGAKSQSRREQYENLKRIVQGRYKNLFIVFCVPDLYLLEWYMSQKRLRAVIKIPRGKRGTLHLFNYAKQSKDFKFRRHNHTIVYPKKYIWGWNRALDGELWEKYLKKKAGYKVEDSKKQKKIRKLRDSWENQKSKYFDAYQAMKVLGVSRPTINAYMKRYKLKAYTSPFGDTRLYFKQKDIERLFRKLKTLKAKKTVSNTKRGGKNKNK